MQIKNIDYKILLKSLILWLLGSGICVVIFAAVMFYLESAFSYSPLFATLAIAVGCLIASFYLGKKIGKKGFLIGLGVGAIVFVIVTLVSLFVNSGSVTIHTLLRLVIILLSSMIGGIIGVNRKANQSYIWWNINFKAVKVKTFTAFGLVIRLQYFRKPAGNFRLLHRFFWCCLQSACGYYQEKQLNCQLRLYNLRKF